MIKEKAVGVDAPNGLVRDANSTLASYQALPFCSTEIASWEHISAPMERVVAKLSLAYAISQPLARVIAENAGLAKEAA